MPETQEVIISEAQFAEVDWTLSVVGAIQDIAERAALADNRDDVLLDEYIALSQNIEAISEYIDMRAIVAEMQQCAGGCGGAIEGFLQAMRDTHGLNPAHKDCDEDHMHEKTKKKKKDSTNQMAWWVLFFTERTIH